MQRGEIWWADLPPPVGSRPVLLLSRNEAYTKRLDIMLAPLTTNIRGIPVEVPVGSEDGLARGSVINLDSIATFPKRMLMRQLAALAPHKMAEVERAIHFALGLST